MVTAYVLHLSRLEEEQCFLIKIDHYMTLLTQLAVF